MQKHVLFSLLFLIAVAPRVNCFDFSQEIRDAQNLSDTFELICAYQKLAKQVQSDASTRLSKKLVRLIKNLHPLCADNEATKVKRAFKSLLETALTNTKLSSVDHTGDLSALLEFYVIQKATETEIETKDASEHNEQEPQEQEWPDITIDFDLPDSLPLQLAPEELVLSPLTIKEKIDLYLAQHPNAKKDVAFQLAIRKLTKRIEKLDNAMQTTNPSIKQIYRKIDTIEQLLKENLLGECPLKALSFLEDNDESSQESPTLLDMYKRTE